MQLPVILLGNGVRGNPALVEHLCSLGVPVLTTWPAMDLVPEDSPVFCGRPGIVPQRAANIVIQKASHLYIFGARLDEQTVGFAGYDQFAPNAIKHAYDIDRGELCKVPFLDGTWLNRCIDLSTCSKSMPPGYIRGGVSAWLAWCKSLYARFRPELDGGPAAPGYIHPFAFIRALSDACRADDVLAMGSSGSAPVSFLQAFRIKQGQRVTGLSTLGAMGADIPMALGACIASGKRRTICLTGEGGFQLNAQELETIRRLRLPITFFVYQNGGYGSIRTMQDTRFGRRLGCDAKSGFTTPDLSSLASCYRMLYSKLSDVGAVGEFMSINAPHIVEVPIDPEWVHLPKVASTLVDGKWQPDRLEDVTPKLPAEELQKIMDWGNE